MNTGSLVNHVMGQSTQPTPEVGMGATCLRWSDRSPYTIVEILSPKKIVVQADDAKRVDTNGISEIQEYVYTSNPQAPRDTITLRKNGRWIEQGESSKGNAYAIGYREKYHDFSH